MRALTGALAVARPREVRRCVTSTPDGVARQWRVFGKYGVPTYGTQAPTQLRDALAAH